MKKSVLLFLSLFFSLVLCYGQEYTRPQLDSVELYVNAQALTTLEESIEYIQHYLATRPAGDTTTHLARIYSITASLFRRMGQIELAGLYTDTAMLVIEASPPPRLVELSLAQFGRSGVYDELNMRPQAVEWLNKSIKTHRKALEQGEPGAEIYTAPINLVGVINAIQEGDDGLAAHYLNHVNDPSDNFEVKRTMEKKPYYRALLADRSGNRKEAVRIGKAHIADVLVRGTEKTEITGLTYQLLGDLYFGEKKYEKSIEYAVAGLRVLRSIKQSEMIERFTLTGIGGLMKAHARLGNFEQVDSLGQVALRYIGRSESRRTEIFHLRFKADQAYIEAIKGNFSSGKAIIDSIFSELTYSPRRTSFDTPLLEDVNPETEITLIKTLIQLQDILIEEYEQKNDPAALIQALEIHSSIDSIDQEVIRKMSFTRSLSARISQSKVSVQKAALLALRLAEENPRYQERAWELTTALKSNILNRHLQIPIMSEVFKLPAEIVDQKTKYELRIIEIGNELAKNDSIYPNRWTDSLHHYRNEILRINQLIERDHQDFASAIKGKKVVGLSHLLEVLPADQAIVEFSADRDTTLIFTIDKINGIRVTKIPNEENLGKKVKSLTDSIEVATELFETFLRDPLSNLPSSVTRLQIIPDGELWNLPFAALKKDGRFLIEDYAISYAYSTGLLFDPELRKAVESSRTSFAGFGLSYDAILKELQGSGSRSVSDYDLLDLEGLPYARDEVTTIGKITKGDTWLDGKATKNNFLDAIPGYEQLYLAMHGLSDPDNPLENALVFASTDTTKKYELLTTREILAQSIQARLAVLSACHTGAGPLEVSEGVQSMARAFTFAGVKATLASNWEANDEVTRNIMVRFYEEVRQGKPLDVAQQIATVAYLEQASPAFQKPEFWANLTLTGFTQPVYGNGWPWWMIGLLAVVGLGISWLLLRRLRV